MPNWNEIRNEWETSKVTLAALAEKYGVKLGTLKSRKSREGWTRDATKKDATKNEKVASISNEVASTKKNIDSEKEPVIENDDLTDKQRLFCIYYTKYWNATKAYQKAYECAYSTAMVEGHKHLRNPKIRLEIDKIKSEQTNELKLDARTILQKYIDIAFADITDFVEFGTEEIPGGELEEELTGVDQSYISNFVRFKGDHEVDGTIITEVKKGKDGVAIKLADKMKALEMLTKYFDLLSDNDKKRLQEEKLRMDIEKTKAEVIHIKGEGEEYEDDGFLDAVKSTAGIWDDENE